MIVSHPPPTAWMRFPAKVTSALLRPPSLLPEHSSLFIYFSARSLAVRVLAHQGLSKTTLHCTALHCEGLLSALTGILLYRPHEFGCYSCCSPLNTLLGVHYPQFSAFLKIVFKRVSSVMTFHSAVFC
ncbi:hypothetical protein M758_1G104600 [Ceratodon purpureus]|nr:hypothetical protein M758_1G104600 [Ceratodon purpureus]